MRDMDTQRLVLEVLLLVKWDWGFHTPPKPKAGHATLKAMKEAEHGRQTAMVKIGERAGLTKGPLRLRPYATSARGLTEWVTLKLAKKEPRRRERKRASGLQLGTYDAEGMSHCIPGKSSALALLNSLMRWPLWMGSAVCQRQPTPHCRQCLGSKHHRRI
jgi:hypothetical protein